MANKMIRRVETDQIVYGRDLNRFLDVILGNSPGRISLLDDGGDELDLHDGSVVSSNNYSLKVRSAVGRHGLYQHSAGSLKVLDLQDSGVTTDVAFTANGNVTLGNAATDTLTVNSTAQFVNAVTFDGNVTLGNASGDAIAVNGTTTANASVTLTGSSVLTLPAGSASAPSLAVGEATTGLFRPSAGVLGLATNGVERARLSLTGGLALASGITVVLSNNTAYQVTETGGTVRNALRLNASDILELGMGQFAELRIDTVDTRIRYLGTDRIRADSNGIGVFGATPIAQQSIAAAATDLASVITLANDLRSKFRNYGWFS